MMTRNIFDSLSASLLPLLLRPLKANTDLNNSCHGNQRDFQAFVTTFHSHTTKFKQDSLCECVSWLFLWGSQLLPLLIALGLTQTLRGKQNIFLRLEIKSHERGPGLTTAAACSSRVDLFRGSTGSGIPAMVSLGPTPTPSIWATFPEKAPAAFTTMAHSTGWYSRLLGI